MRRKITKIYVKIFNSTGRFKNILKVFEQFFLVSEAKITGFVTPCRKLVASFFLGITGGDKYNMIAFFKMAVLLCFLMMKMLKMDPKKDNVNHK